MIFSTLSHRRLGVGALSVLNYEESPLGLLPMQPALQPAGLGGLGSEYPSESQSSASSRTKHAL